MKDIGKKLTLADGSVLMRAVTHEDMAVLGYELIDQPGLARRLQYRAAICEAGEVMGLTMPERAECLAEFVEAVKRLVVRCGVLPAVLPAEERIPMVMSGAQARVIRTWRVELDCTWGRVAELACMAWGWPTGSITGEQYCTAAAELLGEDPGEAPWN